MNFNFFSLAKDGEARDGNMNINEIAIASDETKKNSKSDFTLKSLANHNDWCRSPSKLFAHSLRNPPFITI